MLLTLAGELYNQDYTYNTLCLFCTNKRAATATLNLVSGYCPQVLSTATGNHHTLAKSSIWKNFDKQCKTSPSTLPQQAPFSQPSTGHIAHSSEALGLTLCKFCSRASISEQFLRGAFNKSSFGSMSIIPWPSSSTPKYFSVFSFYICVIMAFQQLSAAEEWHAGSTKEEGKQRESN